MNDESSAEIKAGRCLVALCVIAFLGEVAKPALQASAELTTKQTFDLDSKAITVTVLAD